LRRKGSPVPLSPDEIDATNLPHARIGGFNPEATIELLMENADPLECPGYSDNDLKAVTKDVTIFPISVGQILRILRPAPRRGMGIPVDEMTYLQADNEMRTFAAMTGGRAYFPRFQAEYGEDFQDIGNDIRNQYSITYRPTNDKLDGTYRKLKVQVVAPDGGQFKVKDQKGKDQKVDVVARDGYTARHSVD